MKPFNVPNILVSLKRDIEGGKITIREAAEELYQAGWMNHIDEDRVKSLLKIEKSYVVVVNKKGSIPLRHIITIHTPYTTDDFKKWYYDQYCELDGDEFVHCPTRKELDAYISELKNVS